MAEFSFTQFDHAFSQGIQAEGEDGTPQPAMGFVPGRFQARGPETGLVGQTKGERQNGHQGGQFEGIGHMAVFQSQAACFQAGKQRFDSPALSTAEQN